MRFEARWNNGYWKTFDTLRYTDTSVHGLQSECVAQVAKLNARAER